MKKSTMLASLFATFAVTATAGVGGMLTNTANADIGGLGTFKIEDGASVRITATEDIKDGLRFQVKMDATTVAKIVNATSVYGVDGTDADNAYKLYAVIAPADVVSGGDFTKVDRKNWVEIDENKIYYSEENSCYYANAVLTNVKEWNRYRAFTMGAVIENGTSSVWEDPANEGYRYRSLYQTVNLASLSATENTANIINNADTTYKNWFGKDGYPIMVTTEDQLSSMITDVTSEAYSFADKMIYVDGAVKATDTYATAVADGGALNAIASELGATYYDVTFKADEDTTLYTYKAKSGATAVYNGWTFSKPADGLNNTYTNQGWDESLGAVNANVSYTAEYKAVANDKYTTFNESFYEIKEIKGEDEVVTRIKGINPSVNRYPYAILPNTYTWADGKALTFNVYNNSEVYGYTFAVYMYPTNDNSFNTGSGKFISYYTVEPKDTQTITIYAEDFDYNTYKYVTINTSHYIMCSGKGADGAQDDIAKGELDLASFDISTYGFTFGDKVKPTTDDYIQATSASGDCNVGLNTNKDYVYEGDYSLSITNNGNWCTTNLDFTKDYDWSTVGAVKFYAYNPTTYNYKLGYGYYDVAQAKKIETDVVNFPAGEWTEIVFNASKYELLDGAYIYLNHNYTYMSNVSGQSNTAPNRAFRMYVDGFEIVEAEEKIEIYSNFNSYGQETKTINGEVENVITFGGINPSVNRYPYAILPMEYEWANGKALTFTVYNNSDTYGFTFKVAMSAYSNVEFAIAANPNVFIGFYTVEPNDTQTITIYASDFDYNTYKYVSFNTSHYMMCSGQGTANGKDDISTGELDLAAFNISVYDFTFGDQVKPTTDDYKQATQVSGDCNETLNTNKKYVKDGDYSLGLTNSGNWCVTNIDFMKEYDWSKIDSVTFHVYNPTTYTYKLNLYLNNGAGTAVVNQEGVVLTTGGWKEITFANLKGSMAAGSYVSFSTNYTLMSNVSGAANTAPNRAFRIYLDGFSVVEGNFSADDALWTQTSKANYVTATVNENSAYVKEGQYSVNLKPTANWPTFTFAQSATIDWTKVSKITFDVYNPNAFAWAFGAGVSTNEADYNQMETYYVPAGQWTTIEVVVPDTAVLGNWLKIGLGYNLAVYLEDGTKFVTATSTSDANYVAFKATGLYFDNFVVSYK